jgi:hypothetical protein
MLPTCRRHVACRDIIVDFGVDSQSTANRQRHFTLTDTEVTCQTLLVTSRNHFTIIKKVNRRKYLYITLATSTTTHFSQPQPTERATDLSQPCGISVASELIASQPQCNKSNPRTIAPTHAAAALRRRRR